MNLQYDLSKQKLIFLARLAPTPKFRDASMDQWNLSLLSPTSYSFKPWIASLLSSHITSFPFPSTSSWPLSNVRPHFRKATDISWYPWTCHLLCIIHPAKRYLSHPLATSGVLTLQAPNRHDLLTTYQSYLNSVPHMQSDLFRAWTWCSFFTATFGWVKESQQDFRSSGVYPPPPAACEISSTASQLSGHVLFLSPIPGTVPVTRLTSVDDRFKHVVVLSGFSFFLCQCPIVFSQDAFTLAQVHHRSRPGPMLQKMTAGFRWWHQNQGSCGDDRGQMTNKWNDGLKMEMTVEYRRKR